MRKMLLLALFAAGCGGASYAPPPQPPVTPNASVVGPYDLVLTSASGRGTTYVYTNFTQDGATFSGGANTLLCPADDLAQCEGQDFTGVSILPTGTISAKSITMTIPFPGTPGAHSAALIGTAMTGSSFDGSYTDNLGDAGTWTAWKGFALNGSVAGTFNSTSHPLLIVPQIAIVLGEDTGSSNLTGTVTLMSFPCISSLSLTGQSIGMAFSANDETNQAQIIAVPTTDNTHYNFSYRFGSNAAQCAGDVGRGTISSLTPWDY